MEYEEPSNNNPDRDGHKKLQELEEPETGGEV